MTSGRAPILGQDLWNDDALDLEAQASLFRPLYLHVWHNVLGVFLNWPPARIDEWASKWKDGLDNKWYGGLFYHDTAVRYVVRLLVPGELWGRLKIWERSHLVGRIEAAVSLKNTGAGLAQPHDWEAAKHRVETVLSEYGVKLPVYTSNAGEAPGKGDEGNP